MNFYLTITRRAKEDIRELKNDRGLEKRYKAVKKALKYLEQNPRHPSLQTHQYKTLFGPKREKVFEAYAEDKTSAAYRIFFYYGSNQGEIVVFTITPHP